MILFQLHRKRNQWANKVQHLPSLIFGAAFFVLRGKFWQITVHLDLMSFLPFWFSRAGGVVRLWRATTLLGGTNRAETEVRVDILMDMLVGGLQVPIQYNSSNLWRGLRSVAVNSFHLSQSKHQGSAVLIVHFLWFQPLSVAWLAFVYLRPPNGRCKNIHDSILIWLVVRDMSP